jgi:drug/metabolite transporter (DMT)-like permease
MSDWFTYEYSPRTTPLHSVGRSNYLHTNTMSICLDAAPEKPIIDSEGRTTQGKDFMQLAARLPHITQRKTLRAIFYMTLSAFCFAFVELVGGIFVDGLSLYQVVWGRYAFHLLFMVVVLGPHYKTRLVRTTKLPIQIIRSLTMFAMPVCFIVAVQRMPTHDVWAIYWTSPLVMLALSVWVLGEPAGLPRWIASAVGFIGMLFVFQPSRGIFDPAAIFAFGVGVAISLHLMFSRILRHDHPLTSLFHTALWVFCVMCLVLPLLNVWQTPSLRQVFGICLIGFVGLITLLVLARSSELVPIPVVAGFAYTEAIFRVAITFVVFGTLPNRFALLGVAIITVVSAYLLYYEVTHPYPGLEDQASTSTLNPPGAIT